MPKCEVNKKKRKKNQLNKTKNVKKNTTNIMANPEENIDSNHAVDGQDCDDTNKDDPENVHYVKFETTVVSSSKPIPPQSNAQQQPPLPQQQQTSVTYHRNGHSRNPSSINGITIATQSIQPPPNKPDAIHNLLKLIRFRSDYDECDEKTKNRQICGIREARLFSKWILKIFDRLYRIDYDYYCY